MTSTDAGATPAHAALTLPVRCAEDLLAVVPLAVGFHPEESVVMVTSDGSRPFHARVDLPSRSDPPEVGAAIGDHLVAVAARNGVRSMALAFYSSDDRAIRSCWAALRRASARAGLRVVEAVRTDGRRYHPLLRGRRLRDLGIPYDAATHPYVAEAVVHGIVVEESRAAVAASIAPVPPRQRAVHAAAEAAGLVGADPPRAAPDRRRCGELVRQLVRGHLAAGTRPTDAEVALLCWAVQDVRVRDAAGALVDRGGAARHQAYWADVVRRAPDDLVAAPAVLLAWAAWRAGRGAMAWIAIDRCREVDPGNRLAGLLARCLEEAVPPDVVGSELGWDEGLPP